MIRGLLMAGVVLACLAHADTVTLKDGKTVHGTYLGGDARQIRIAIGERVQTFDIGDVSGIQFGTSGSSSPSRTTAASTPAPASTERSGILRPERGVPAPAAASSSRGEELPAGTVLMVRMIDDVDSERDRVGQEFRASIDEPVTVNGTVIVPRGADVVVKLVDDKEAGKLSGRTELTMDLVSVKVDGRRIDINTSEVTKRGDSQTKRTAGLGAGGAALGAVIGAIAGGGKGAAIGAVSGAGAGAAVGVMTRGSKVRVPSETRLEFTTQYPVKL
jgi:hypothetical protein